MRKDAGGITQAAAAERVGAPRETWNKWESAKHPRSLSAYYARVIEDRFELEDGELEPFVESRQAAEPDEVAHLWDRIERLEARLESALNERGDHGGRRAARK